MVELSESEKGAVAELSENDRKLWGMLAHLTALSAYVGLPLGNIIGPLVIWLLKRNESAFVDDQGKESLNFQVSVTIYVIIAAFLCLVVIGFVILPIIYVVALILTIVGSVKANNGEAYRYPLTIRLIK